MIYLRRCSSTCIRIGRLVVWLNGLNIGVVLRSGLLPMVWDSSLEVVDRHAITIFIPQGVEYLSTLVTRRIFTKSSTWRWHRLARTTRSCTFVPFESHDPSNYWPKSVRLGFWCITIGRKIGTEKKINLEDFYFSFWWTYRLIQLWLWSQKTMNVVILLFCGKHNWCIWNFLE